MHVQLQSIKNLVFCKLKSPVTKTDYIAIPSDFILTILFLTQGSRFEKKIFLSEWDISQGTALKFTEDRCLCESNPMKCGAIASPIFLRWRSWGSNSVAKDDFALAEI